MTATIKMLSTARLWDANFNLLGSALVDPEITPSHVHIKVEGDGPMHGAAQTIFKDGSLLDSVHLTIDPEPTNLTDFQNRIGAVVDQITVDRRLCECGRTLITTTVRGARTDA